MYSTRQHYDGEESEKMWVKMKETTIQTEVNTRMIVFCDIFVSNSKNRKQVSEQMKIMIKNY